VSDEKVAIVRRIYAALAAGDWDAAIELAGSDVELVAAEQSPLAGTYRGHEGVREFFRRVFEIWDEREFRRRPEELKVVGDNVVATVRVHARFKGSGIELDERWADLWTVREGKVTRVEVFTDPAHALKAAGAQT
jgi:ketosteroid isomerase-like protein